MAKFADILKILRIEKGLTQQELAEALRYKKSRISMYERGEGTKRTVIYHKNGNENGNEIFEKKYKSIYFSIDNDKKLCYHISTDKG